MSKFSDSPRRSKPEKPAKPHPDFPLFPHDTGRWAKKVRGRTEYFGPWDDPQQALENWNAWKDDLLAGKRPGKGDGLTIKSLVNQFLNHHRELHRNGENAESTLSDYIRACEYIVDVFGRTRNVEGLDPDDFAKLRKHLAQGRNSTSLHNEIGRARVVFNFGAGLLNKPINYGPMFSKPSRKELRKTRTARGKRMYEPAELRKMLDTAKQPLRAMLWLAINAGLGQTDLAKLPISAIDFDRGRLDYPRPKTGVERHCPLWPETIEQLRLAIKRRPLPKDKADAGLAFLTKYGHRFVRMKPSKWDSKDPSIVLKWTPIDGISQEFRKLCKSAKITGNRGFYAIRHTFETVGGDTTDQIAVDFIMGHVDDTMAGTYREHIFWPRLKRVVSHVHKWLFPKKLKKRQNRE